MMKSGASSIRGKLNQVKIKRKKQKNRKRQIKKKEEKNQKKKKPKRNKKGEEEEFVPGGPGQNMRLLSLPYSLFLNNT